MNKISLKDYSEFRKNYKLKEDKLVKKEDGIYYGNSIVKDSEGNKYSEGEDYIDVAFNAKNDKASILSNLSNIKFKFRGKKANSIEGVLQGIKHKDKKLQRLVFACSGLTANHTRASDVEGWTKEGYLYWNGKAIKRDSEEYQLFIDELYISVCSNPIYTNSLLATGNKYLLHSMGNPNANETVLSRYEYELRLNSLRDYLRSINYPIYK